MELSQLCEKFCAKDRFKSLAKAIGNRNNKVLLAEGVAGSSLAMLLSCLPPRTTPYLIIANDLDEAGYIYNDLCQIMTDKRVLVFPSGYKRSIKFGQVDAPQQILRTEVLNRWEKDKELRWVVSYPEALAEKVATREQVSNGTINLAVGEVLDLTQLQQQLRNLGFVSVDYV
ncbi:MAG: transcription-repair coupling factor, partial [Muribaculaceae bacterium]|nr:transcription-repair coupling factor [Muribaculaceae bacterium]